MLEFVRHFQGKASNSNRCFNAASFIRGLENMIQLAQCTSRRGRDRASAYT